MTNKNSTYKRLGDYIREVDVRNSKLEVNLSQGICNMKYFQNPRQVSSTPHLDKIVRKGQFAYNRATTRNGNKLSIAYREGEDCTVSSAYCVFYILDENQLNPYYLWLWFKRPDFDRYAIFKSHGSAHEFFEFETLCDTYIPVPSIEEQRKIVDHYLAIETRISNNKQTIAKLEEAAQALYRKMFVDDVDVENLPDGWRMGIVGDLFELQRGFDLPSQKRNIGKYPICASTGISQFHDEYKVKAPGVVTGRSGSIGEVFYINEDFWPLNTTLWVKDFKESSSYFVFYKLKELDLAKTIGGFAAVPTLNRNDVHAMESIVPSFKAMEIFQEKVSAIHSFCDNCKKENEKLTEMLSLMA